MKNNSKEIRMEFPLHGFDKKDIKVDLTENRITINAEKKQENKVQKKDFFHEEKIYRNFSYSATLPGINPKKAKTEFNKGVLKIKVQKKK